MQVIGLRINDRINENIFLLRTSSYFDMMTYMDNISVEILFLFQK